MEKLIHSWTDGQEVKYRNQKLIDKVNPHTGSIVSKIVESDIFDINCAIDIAQKSFALWSNVNPVERGKILFNFSKILFDKKADLAKIITLETGKSHKDSFSEINAAIAQCNFFAGEGMRLYGKTLTSGLDHKYTHTIRQAIGIAGLIVPANTPIANIAWKVFPALICGNTIVLKASEDAPEIALEFARLSKIAGLPDGVLNVVQGRGDPVGINLVTDNRINIISFTGSTSVGKWIAENGGKRLARLSLELGGKNPFVVCDDADLDKAVYWASLSAFSNAGQRCASGSRIFVSENIYESFREKLLEKIKYIKLGIDDNSDYGPVINYKQFTNISNLINESKKEGGVIHIGGQNNKIDDFSNGYYIFPTIIENLNYDSILHTTEIFGPVATLNSFRALDEIITICNKSEFGLTAAIHTKSIDKAVWFTQKIKAGVVNVNIGTYGSEPHMPFGGFGSSGNGTREPGEEALNIYTELKNISFFVNLDRL